MDIPAIDIIAADRKRIVCGWCGSEDVSRDAWAEWDLESQDWVLQAVFDDGHCHRCGCARGLEEQSVEEDAHGQR